MKKSLVLLIIGMWAGVFRPQALPQAVGPDIPLDSPHGVAASLLPFVKDQAFAGAVTLVASKDKVLSLETVGYSDLAAKRPMRADDLFLICSMTKVFTAAGVMMLVDEGKLNLDDPVEKYLPQFKGQMVAVREADGRVQLKKPAHPITIKNLLTHTSGLPTKTNGLIPLSESVPQHAAKPLGFEPDTQWLYSNVGINTAGRIIEVVSGMPYGEFIEKRLVAPLGLKDTTFWPTPAQAARIAKPYQRKKGTDELEFARMGAYPTPSSDHKCVAQPCSGLFSTASDIGRFCQMFLQGGMANGTRILSQQSVRQMTIVQTGKIDLHGSPVEGCGLGWRVAKKAPGTADTLSVGTFSHGGALKTGMWVDPRRQLVLVLMMQLNSPQRAECQRALTKAALAAFANTATSIDPPARTPQTAQPAAKLGTPGTFNRARFFPAAGHEQAMLHGKFCGSNASAKSGYEVLAEITAAPPAGKWTEISFPNTKAYRWIRYEAPPGSYGMVAEMEFYFGKRKGHGRMFGSLGWHSEGAERATNWPRAFDKKTDTWFCSDTSDGQYVGMDMGDWATAQTPELEPPACDRREPLEVALKCATRGAVIRYSLSGAPTQEEGTLYTQPIRLEHTATIFAVAFREGMPPSPAASGTYIVGAAIQEGLHTLHVGNSLTAALRRLPAYVHTTGYLHDYREMVKDAGQTAFAWRSVQSTNKVTWEKLLAGMAKIDHFSVQPRPVCYDDEARAEEAKYDVLFFNAVRAKCPQMQPWIFAEWPARKPQERRGGWPPIFDAQMKDPYPAPTYEEASSALLMHIEAIQQKVLRTYKQGKRPRIVPGTLAVARLKNLLDEGKIPGLSSGDMGDLMFHDSFHPDRPGQYLLCLTWYAAFYGQSPENKVPPVGIDLSPAQASVMQRLAWDVVKNYPDCGFYEEGTTRCGKPAFSPAAEKTGGMRRVTLTSATPGAWFRYTLDGTIPTRTHGYVYCGVVSVRPGMTFKAVAYKSGMADSEVAEAKLDKILASARPQRPVPQQ
jgi:CubicO group peptidase (beta-lactamase class C family)